MNARESLRRRALLAAGGAWILGTSLRLGAQPARTVKRVASILPGTASAYRTRFDAFSAELKGRSQIEGRDILIDARWADERLERLPQLAAEVVAQSPAVILTATSAGVRACMRATSKVPIVFATAGTPVEQKFITSLARPGGNVTGVMVHSLEAKIVEIAREALPGIKRVAILVHEADPISGSMRDAFVAACTRFGIEPMVVIVRGVEELSLAFNEVRKVKPDALYLPNTSFMLSNGAYLAQRALEARIALLTGRQETTTDGGLLSYGTDRLENFRKAAVLVDKILRGANPAELPVEVPERFQFVVNRKTARAIGATISPAALVRADRIIE